MSSDSQSLDNALSEWKKFNKSRQFDDEFVKLVEENDDKKLRRLFLSRLEFGTAGLRGRMGAGFACMNDVVVIQACQGLLEYLQKVIKDLNTKGVVIGYDGRYFSKRFAQLTATIFLNAQVKVYLFPDVNPTPFVPFAIKLFKCAAGVMVTASHNPKEDNGYKVYWENSAQIISPHDKGISECIMRNLKPQETSWKTEIIDNNPEIINPFPEVMAAYTSRRLNLAYDLTMNQESNCSFTYTAMHGVGYRYLQYVFENLKFNYLIPVEEQMDPDPEFPTVKFPNPEEGKSALNLSFQTAEKNKCTIILANDPDADRFAVAEKIKDTNKWKVFTGNETGALLGWWMLENYKQKHPDKKDFSDVYFISSTVSSKILQTVAKAEKLSFEETLTGFKWMGNKADELEKQGKTVLFAFEESIGFMCDVDCLDKDGISAAAKVAELTLYARNSGLTLNDKLEEIYAKYGQHLYSSSYFFCYDQDVIKKIFNRIRTWNGQSQSYPDSIGDGKYKITSVRDLTAGFDSSMPDNKPILPVSKSSQMITFSFENGFICTLRTSGTEPKIKYYSELISSPEEKDIEKLKQRSLEMVNTLVEELLQPKLNNLIPKSD
ncbi:phosphopentomutase [Planococcus citri]|uniref:phosphopentomutase n=1 Tax=Planococcus citri TaxID=170843 RepID=UPI0031F73268